MMPWSHLLIVMVCFFVLLWLSAIPTASREAFTSGVSTALYNSRDIYRQGCPDINRAKVAADINRLPITQHREAFNKLHASCKFKPTMDRLGAVLADANDMLIMSACMGGKNADLLNLLDAQAGAPNANEMLVEKFSMTATTLGAVKSQISSRLQAMAAATAEKKLMAPIFTVIFQGLGGNRDTIQVGPKMKYVPSGNANATLSYDVYILAPCVRKSGTTYKNVFLTRADAECQLAHLAQFYSQNQLCFIRCAGTASDKYPSFCGCKNNAGGGACMDEAGDYSNYGIMYEINPLAPDMEMFFANDTQTAEIKSKSPASSCKMQTSAPAAHSIFNRGQLLVDRATPIADLNGQNRKPLHNTTGDFTFSFWMRKTRNPHWHDWPQWVNIFRWGNEDWNGQRRPALYIGGDALIHYRQSTNKDWNDGHHDFVHADLHKWDHFAFVTRGQEILTYVNGKERTRRTYAGLPVVDREGKMDFVFNHYNTGQYYGICLAKFRYFDGALPAGDIKTLASETVGGLIRGTMDVARYHRFSPDTRALGWGPFEALHHYATTGIPQKRRNFIVGHWPQGGTWSDEGYLDTHQDVKRAGMTARHHFANWGWKENRQIVLRLDDLDMTPHFNHIPKTRGKLARRIRFLPWQQSQNASDSREKLNESLKPRGGEEWAHVSNFTQSWDSFWIARHANETDDAYALRVWERISGEGWANSGGHQHTKTLVKGKQSIGKHELQSACQVALNYGHLANRAREFGCQSVVAGRDTLYIYAAEYTGWFVAPVSGIYTFGIRGDDAVDFALYVDGKWKVLTHHYGLHGTWAYAPNPGTIFLEQNSAYPVRVRLHQNWGAAGLIVEWIRPDAGEKKLVPIPFDTFYVCDHQNWTLMTQVDTSD